MFLFLILMLIFSSNVYAEKLPPLKARVNINTGEVDNVGRGMDYSGILTPDTRVFMVPENLDPGKLIYDQGEIREKKGDELEIDRKATQRMILIEKIVKKKQRLDAMQGLSGINWTDTFVLQQEINDLRQEINKL